MSQNFSAQGMKRRQYPGYLAKFHNAVMENSGHKAAVHNLIRGSLIIYAVVVTVLRRKKSHGDCRGFFVLEEKNGFLGSLSLNEYPVPTLSVGARDAN